jgi:predicted amidohydrolase
MQNVNIAILQMKVKSNKKESVASVRDMIHKLDTENLDFIILPEMFNCPYETSNFPIYAEKEGEYTYEQMAKIAREHKVYLIAGSMPERDENDKIYNTSYAFDRDGNCIGKHRKIHLFDVDIKGGQYFKESDTLTAGENMTIVDTEFGEIGICICYDIRFPELSRAMGDAGAKIIMVPAAFNTTTGPAHWDTLFRARALDQQVFMVGVAPARDKDASYQSWGHSIVVSPWGQIVEQMDEREGFVKLSLDLSEIDKVREAIPVLKQRKF